MLYSAADFQGECYVFDCNQQAVPEKLLTKSCRVAGGRWGGIGYVMWSAEMTGNEEHMSEINHYSMSDEEVKF